MEAPISTVNFKSGTSTKSHIIALLTVARTLHLFNSSFNVIQILIETELETGFMLVIICKKKTPGVLSDPRDTLIYLQVAQKKLDG